MELGNIEFLVVCDYENVIEDAIALYNSTYKTDFRLVEYIEDEVMLAKINVSESRVSDIFDLGKMYGKMTLRRQQKESSL